MARHEETKEVWIVGEIARNMAIGVDEMGNWSIKMPWHKGIVGICPVFDGYEHAKAYADEREKTTGASREVWPLRLFDRV